MVVTDHMTGSLINSRMLVVLSLLACLLNFLYATVKSERFSKLRFTAACNQRDFEKARLILNESSSAFHTNWVTEKALLEAVLQGDVEKARFIFEVNPNIEPCSVDLLFSAALENGHASMVRLFIRSHGLQNSDDGIFKVPSLLPVILLHRDHQPSILQRISKSTENYLVMLADPRVTIEDNDVRPDVALLRSCKRGVKPKLEGTENKSSLVQVLMRCAGTHGHLRLFLDLLEDYRELAYDNDAFLRELDYMVDYAWTFHQYDVISGALFNSGLFLEMPTEVSLCIIWLEFKTKSMEHAHNYVLAKLIEAYTRHYLLLCFLYKNVDENSADVALAVWRAQIALLHHK